jgi:hypothetical protein
MRVFIKMLSESLPLHLRKVAVVMPIPLENLRLLQMHLEAAQHLLAAIQTGVNLRLETDLFTADQANNMEKVWEEQLANVHQDVTVSRRILESARRSRRK